MRKFINILLVTLISALGFVGCRHPKDEPVIALPKGDTTQIDTFVHCMYGVQYPEAKTTPQYKGN